MSFIHVICCISGCGATVSAMGFEAELDREVTGYRAATYAQSTKKSYSTHRKRYFAFCSQLGVAPVPASCSTIARYAAYLARCMKPASVRQYLNIIRVLHLENNLPNPLQDDWLVKSTLTGIDRLLGSPATRRTRPPTVTNGYL